MTTLEYKPGLRFVLPSNNLDLDGNQVLLGSVAEPYLFAENEPYCGRQSNFTPQTWQCTRTKGHGGDHIACINKYADTRILGIWGNDSTADIYNISIGDALAKLENDYVEPLPVFTQERDSPEYELGYDGVVFSQLPVIAYEEISESRQCSKPSPNMGWPCTREKGHYNQVSPHRSTNFTVNKVFALWKEK